VDGITTAATQSAAHVFSTTFDATRAALSAAIPLAKGSDARLIVIVPKIVSYTIPLDQHIDSTEFLMRRYRDLVREFDGEAQLRLCVCRRVDDVLRQVLPQHATVVVGGPARAWFPSGAMKLIRRLTELGHQTVFVVVPHKARSEAHRSGAELTIQASPRFGNIWPFSHSAEHRRYRFETSPRE
jgi:hypothetical protein